MHARDPLESQIANLSFLEGIYQQYQSQPHTIDSSWVSFFQKLEEEKGETLPFARAQLMPQVERIAPLIEAYRRHGHLLAKINPIALENVQMPEELKLENLGFQPQDEEALFLTLNLLPQAQAPLKSIVDVLQKRYSQSVGFEFKGFTSPVVESWIQEQIESGRFEKPLKLEDQLIILDVLTRAEVLETFLHTKHVGKKALFIRRSRNSHSYLGFHDIKSS